MHFRSPSRNEKPGKLPVARDPKDSEENTNMDDSRKDSATISLPTMSKPAPARTPSTRIQEPARKPSHMAANASNVHHSNTTKGTQTGGAADKPDRPGLQRRRTTAQTRYIEMLLGLDSVPPLHNLLASFFTWILLAGYIVFPATFNKLQKDDLDKKADSAWKEHALSTVRNVPLLYVAAFACGIGVCGCIWLWWKWRENYVWVINRIFLPALMNSIAGLISTFINVYSAQDGTYSVTARATIIVTSACSVVAAALFLLYNSVMLHLVKRKHARETKAVERDRNTQEPIMYDRKEEGADPVRVV